MYLVDGRNARAEPFDGALHLVHADIGHDKARAFGVKPLGDAPADGAQTLNSHLHSREVVALELPFENGAEPMDYSDGRMDRRISGTGRGPADKGSHFVDRLDVGDGHADIVAGGIGLADPGD